jgi:hypothetical protein
MLMQLLIITLSELFIKWSAADGNYFMGGNLISLF